MLFSWFFIYWIILDFILNIMNVTFWKLQILFFYSTENFFSLFYQIIFLAELEYANSLSAVAALVSYQKVVFL